MAMGYTKATGRLPAVLLHTTVGALHGAMALRAAYHEQVPMLVCAGESVGFGEGGGDYVGFQWQRFLADRGGPARMADPYVKWSFGVNTKVVLPGSVHRACQLAMASPQGPVFLSIPFEYLVEEMVSTAPASYAWPTPPRADARVTSEVVSALSLLVRSVKERTARDEAFVRRRRQRLERWGARNQQRRQAWQEEALALRDRAGIDTRWLCYEINQVLPTDAL